ncbi:MAG: L-iditol 2-dehydrogenase [Clostridiales bacterium]|jgi:2-desacetyl-2-hydroxyethyl bacteriochlorophyllide A dehydrogenase|nr:L-iditol 2-dehydrogenase [Clostridiales bacterium]MDN5298115.1 L-iditol 2-dehydrogenase [Clostridiales bacterium]
MNNQMTNENTQASISTQTMQALIYQDIKDVKLVEKNVPECGPNDVIVRNVRAGICGTDITGYLYGGEKVLINKGSEFGHEMVGYVYKKGTNVNDIAVGARVFVEPARCTPNPYNADMAGAFSQFVRVYNAKVNDNLFLLPDSLPYSDAVLIEPFSVATHGKNTVGAKPGENVLIIGAGTIGLCALSSLIAQGNSHVAVLDIDDRRLALAEKMGGTGFNASKGQEAIVEFLTSHFGTMFNTNHRISMNNGEMTVEANPVFDIDAVIDCAGRPEYVDLFMKHAKQHARLCCIAVHKDAVPIRFHEVMSTQCAIMGSRGYDRADIEEVIQNLDNHNSKVTEIISHVFPLEDAEKAFEIASDPSSAVKVVINLD